MSVSFYGLLIYIVFQTYRHTAWRWVPIALLVLLIIMIGMTRVYLRVHYASDVIAGYCVGFLWLVFAIWLLNRLEKYSMRKLNTVVEQPVGSNTQLQYNEHL
jgi:undecaprenyl-diphosphatase